VIPSHPLGTLLEWSDIADEQWRVLLLGNGLSMNVYPYFGYQSLYAEAHEPDFEEGLSPREQAIFDRFETKNFEVVLAKLRDGIMLAEGMGLDPEPYRRRFLEIQAALGRTVRKVHVPWESIPRPTLAAIKAYGKGFGAVFSTSYDLLLYWSIVHEDDYRDFCDFFWANDRYEFDPDDCKPRRNQTPVHYLHGALHLVVDSRGVTRKLVKSEGGRLLDQFGKATDGGSEERPLLISEGSSRDKLLAIEGNDYLAHAYDRLKKASEPLLVFGHSLGEQDEHLIAAINAHPNRPVAISMRDNGRETLREEQARIRGKLHDRVAFFDASTHPLGLPTLTARTPRERTTSGRWRPSWLAPPQSA
jgi:hypothetical protein